MFKEYLYSLATDRRRGAIAWALKAALYLLSLIYGLMVRIIQALVKLRVLRQHKAACKVISIGNLTVGATGKTPTAAFIADLLKQEGKKAAILSRGVSAFQDIGDEPASLKEDLGDIAVLTGKDRVKSAALAKDKYGVDFAVIDDGFQYRKLMRDLDIVVVDSSNPLGNKNLLPRGILREPAVGLGRADIILLSKADKLVGLPVALLDLKQMISRINPKAAVFETVHEPCRIKDLSGGDLGIDFIKGKEVCSVSGIGDPEYFHKILRDLGSEPKGNFAFFDHHRYTRKHVKDILDFCNKENLKIIVTTAKDAVKLKAFPLRETDDVKICVVKVRLKVLEGLEELKKIIYQI